ncbi:thioredoxin [Beduinella massiliensis]|uniref:thioredoxin n=1 Tax=Beduinella massiliensis TaxID=1852363 RepID=UPI000C8312C3
MNAFVKEFTEQNFETEAMASDLPVLVDFWAPWCGPCRMVAPHVDAVAEQAQGKAIVGKVNVDESSALAQRFGVMSIPTLVVLKGGQMVERVVGARGQADILALLTPYMD